LGCVAGDDTILVVSRSEDDAHYIADRIREMIK
jgi:arginine repressor